LSAKEMQKSTNAATKAANATENSIAFAKESAHLDQRAWVLAVGVTTKSQAEVGKPIVAVLEIKNAGRTPANNFKTHPWIIITGKSRLKDFEQSAKTENIPEGAVIVPGASIFIELTVPADAMKEGEVAAINNGTRWVFVSGTATYDTVGSGNGETQFCYIYEPGKRIFTPYAEGNHAY
jgi:hypothetical protein